MIWILLLLLPEIILGGMMIYAKYLAVRAS